MSLKILQNFEIADYLSSQLSVEFKSLLKCLMKFQYHTLYQGTKNCIVGKSHIKQIYQNIGKTVKITVILIKFVFSELIFFPIVFDLTE